MTRQFIERKEYTIERFLILPYNALFCIIHIASLLVYDENVEKRDKSRAIRCGVAAALLILSPPRQTAAPVVCCPFKAPACFPLSRSLPWVFRPHEGAAPTKPIFVFLLCRLRKDTDTSIVKRDSVDGRGTGPAEVSRPAWQRAGLSYATKGGACWAIPGMQTARCAVSIVPDLKRWRPSAAYARDVSVQFTMTSLLIHRIHFLSSLMKLDQFQSGKHSDTPLLEQQQRTGRICSLHTIFVMHKKVIR